MRLHRLTRLLAGAGLAGLLAGGASAAPAEAESIVYVKGGDLWRADSTGKRQQRLTRDGTPRRGYRSPSQSDSGTIVALKGRRTLHVFNRSGRRVRRPRSITGGPVPAFDPIALDVRFSPNGRLIAFTIDLVRRNQRPDPNAPSGEDLGTSVWVTRLGSAKLINDERTPRSPSWIGNRRLLVFTPYLFHTTDVWSVAVGGGSQEWFQDLDVVNPLDPADGAPLNNGELSRQRDELALIRGPNAPVVNDPTSIRVYAVSGLSSRPVARCDLRTAVRVRYEPPTWAPDGRALAWSEQSGIWSTRIAGGSGDCAAKPKLLLRGAGQPDWGPAPLPRRRR